jgi:hypothetical protein
MDWRLVSERYYVTHNSSFGIYIAVNNYTVKFYCRFSLWTSINCGCIISIATQLEKKNNKTFESLTRIISQFKSTNGIHSRQLRHSFMAILGTR